MRLLKTWTVTSLLFCSNTWATVINAMPWMFDDNSWMAQTFIYDETLQASNQNLRIDTMIAYSKNGEKHLYVRFNHYKEPKSTCSPKDYPQRNTAFFEGQAVKVLAWCNKYSDYDYAYLLISPETEVGEKFVIQKLRNSKKDISFRFGPINVPISTEGFSKAWDSSSGNAL